MILQKKNEMRFLEIIIYVFEPEIIYSVLAQKNTFTKNK